MQFTTQDARTMLFRFAGTFTLVSIFYDVLNMSGVEGFDTHPRYFPAIAFAVFMYFVDRSRLVAAR
jgi:hypothetical protein